MKIEVLFFSVKRLILFKYHEEYKGNYLNILDRRCNRIIYSDEMDFKFKRIWKA